MVHTSDDLHEQLEERSHVWYVFVITWVACSVHHPSPLDTGRVVL